MEENWKPIKGFEKYLISDLGRIKSTMKYKDGIYLNPWTSSNGYLSVSLCKNGKNKNVSIHRLVAMYFIPNINNKNCVDHINRNKKDNKIENLRWATHSENMLNKKYPRGSVYKNKRCNSYRCNYYPERKKVKCKYFKTMEDAERFRQEMYEKYS